MSALVLGRAIRAQRPRQSDSRYALNLIIKRGWMHDVPGTLGKEVVLAVDVDPAVFGNALSLNCLLGILDDSRFADEW